MTAPETSGPSTVRQDFLASIVVFLVALPLCMGIAIASGVPVSAGLITGIIGGSVVGSIAGCPLQVSGPAAGLTVIVYEAVQKFGVETLGLIVLLAGLMQAVAGLLRLGQWFRAVSPAVVRGMLAGIGVLILAAQFHVMFDRAPESSGIRNLIAFPQSIRAAAETIGFPSDSERDAQRERINELRGIQRRQQILKAHVMDRLAHASARAKVDAPQPVDLADLADEQSKIAAEIESATPALAEAYASTPARVEAIKAASAKAVETLKATETALRDPEGRHAGALKEAGAKVDAMFGQSRNPHLAGLIGIATILAMVLWKGFAPKKLQLIPPALVAVLVGTALAYSLRLPVVYVNVPESLLSEIHLPRFESLAAAPWGALLGQAALMAVVASAETLLCCSAVDQMQNGPRTKYDRELFAQGVGNTLCGLVGALPMTGVIVRSTANIQGGGKTRLSAILHGVWLLVFVVGLSSLLGMIPTSCLAAILVYTGYKLIDLKTIKTLKEYGWGEVAIYFATVIVIVTKDLLSGVMVGFALAVLKLLYTFSHLETVEKPMEDGEGVQLDLRGAATFIRLPTVAAAVERVPRGTNLHINLEHLDYVDHACLDLLMSWSKQHEATGGTVTIDWDSLHGILHQNGRPTRQEVAS